MSSFTFLNFSKTAKNARKPNSISKNNQSVVSQKRVNPSFEKSLMSNESSNRTNKESICSNRTLISNLSSDNLNNLVNSNISSDISSTDNQSNQEKSLKDYSYVEKREIFILLSLIFMLSFVCYGVLPGLQSYSTLPYGNDIYNYSVNFSKIFFESIIFK